MSGPGGIYLLKVKNRKTRSRCEICLKLTVKTPERRQWRYSGVFIINSEHISHLDLVFLLLTLNMQLLAGVIKIDQSVECVRSYQKRYQSDLS